MLTVLFVSLFVFLCLCSFPGKYHDLERQLIQEFTAAQRRGEIGRMREVAAVLLHFKVTWKSHVWTSPSHFKFTFHVFTKCTLKFS